jgi:hypothetical protein
MLTEGNIGTYELSISRIEMDEGTGDIHDTSESRLVLSNSSSMDVTLISKR